MKLTLELGLYPAMNDFFMRPERIKILLAGRRCGKTISIILYMISEILKNPDKELRFLFLDVSYSQISKYIDAYGMPILKKLPDKMWRVQNMRNDIFLLKSQILFRTQTVYEALVGLEYDKIFANECSFSIDTQYLYENVLLPMTLNRNGKIYMLGTPTNQNGYFKELSDKAENGELKNSYFKRLSTFDTPYICDKDVEELIENMDSDSVRSEIYAQWTKNIDNKFIYTFDPKKHIYRGDEDCYDRWLNIGIDFNFSQMSVLLFIYEDDTLKIIKEVTDNNSNIDKMCDKLLLMINPKKIIGIYGDASGSNNNAMSYTNMYQAMLNKLGVHKSIFKIPRSNPRHIYSRICCNKALECRNVLINSECKQTITALNKAQIDKDMSIVKKPIDYHYLDVIRYCIHGIYPLKDILDN